MDTVYSRTGFGIERTFDAYSNCTALIQELDHADKWGPAQIFSGPSPQRTNEDVHLTRLARTTHPSLLAYDVEVFKAFEACVAQYCLHFSHLRITTDEGLIALRYKPGQEYAEHIDAGMSDNRILSGILYLNDDYEGGLIEFPLQELRIKPRAGELLLFPSGYTHPHRSTPVLSGVKYAVVTWFRWTATPVPTA